MSSLPGHVVPHTPRLHASSVAQVVPGLPASPPQPSVAPQWAWLVLGSTHAPLQSMSPPEQTKPHWPARQTSPVAHAVPAVPEPALQPVVAPQKFLFVAGSMQLLPQRTSSPGHADEHRPARQASSAAQALPQAPQSPWLVARSTQWPEQIT